MATGRPTRLNGNTGVALRILHYYIMRSKLVVLCEYGFFSHEMANNGRIALSHAKFANHHCWFDALALTMQIAVDQSPLLN